jgi:hypothetical protein
MHRISEALHRHLRKHHRIEYHSEQRLSFFASPAGIMTHVAREKGIDVMKSNDRLFSCNWSCVEEF